MPGLYPWIFGESHSHWSFHEDQTNATTVNCSDGVQWAWVVLRDCVHNGQGVASDILGLASLLSWIIVSIPQMVMNCRNIRGVEGISILLILQWTLGDTTNLIGSILTNQLPLQVYLAVYFVFADVILFCQYLYYQFWKWQKTKEQEKPQSSGPSRIVLCFTGAFMTMNGVGMVMTKFLNIPKFPGDKVHIPGATSRRLMAANLSHVQFFKLAMHYLFWWAYYVPFPVLLCFQGIKDESGYAIGIVSSLFYVGSRLSQIYKNYKRKSTEGLSVLMFILAVIGNATYGLSILVRSLDGAYVLHHLPWLVGSLGVIFLDVSLLVQFKYYGVRDFDTLSNQPLVENDVNTITFTEARVDSNGVIN